MKIKNLFFALVLFAGTLGLTGCFDEFAGSYDGPLQLEFKPTSLDVASGAGVVQLPVQLIGPQQLKSFTYRAHVVDSLTTATAGEDFNLVATEYTFEADSSFSAVAVDVLDGVQSGEEETVVIALEPNDVVQVAENYKTFTLVIYGE